MTTAGLIRSLAESVYTMLVSSTTFRCETEFFFTVLSLGFDRGA